MKTQDKTRINLYLPNVILESIDKEAKEKGTSRTSVLITIIQNYTKQIEMMDTLKDLVNMAKINKE